MIICSYILSFHNFMRRGLASIDVDNMYFFINDGLSHPRKALTHQSQYDDPVINYKDI